MQTTHNKHSPPPQEEGLGEEVISESKQHSWLFLLRHSMRLFKNRLRQQHQKHHPVGHRPLLHDCMNPDAEDPRHHRKRNRHKADRPGNEHEDATEYEEIPDNLSPVSARLCVALGNTSHDPFVLGDKNDGSECETRSEDHRRDDTNQRNPSKRSDERPDPYSEKWKERVYRISENFHGILPFAKAEEQIIRSRKQADNRPRKNTDTHHRECPEHHRQAFAPEKRIPFVLRHAVDPAHHRIHFRHRRLHGSFVTAAELLLQLHDAALIHAKSVHAVPDMPFNAPIGNGADNSDERSEEDYANKERPQTFAAVMESGREQCTEGGNHDRGRN